MSHYTTCVSDWLSDLGHEHKCGSCLQFMLNNESIDEYEDIYDSVYDRAFSNGEIDLDITIKEVESTES